MTTLEKLAELQSKATTCSMALSAFYSECIQTDFAALSAEMDRMKQALAVVETDDSGDLDFIKFRIGQIMTGENA